MSEINRREFMERAAAVAGALSLGAPVLAEEQKSVRKPTDKVKLGKTKIVSSRIGIGTGSIGWNHQSNQTRLGQQKFTELIRHAYDSGITFFDCADQYGSHPYVKEAIKGLPRDKFVIESKIIHRTAEEARADLDRFRKELGVEYIDIVLMHVVTEGDWTTRYKGVRDVLEEAKQKGVIRAHGCSCHSLEALRTAADEPWVDIDLARYNPWGMYMDNKQGDPQEKAPEHVRPILADMKKAGKGVIGMKILGQGDMMHKDDRLARARESLKFALGSGVIDMMVIGFESPQQITEIVNEARVAFAELDGVRKA